MLGNNGARLKTRFMKQGIKVPKYNLTKDNSFLIFPFNITMGYITSTENGIRQNDSVNVFDYSTFQRVFTGLENVLAQWQNAYKVEKKKDNDTFLTKEYVVGKSIRGYVPQETLSASFQPTSISGDFLAEFTEETFTIHSYDDLTEEDLFKLYIIPELKEEKWLYVTNAEKLFLPNGELHHVEITLSTLNNQIAKTGQAIEEYVQRSAPGEGYAWPLVNKNGDVSVDLQRNKDIPVTSVQIEGAGAIAMGTIYAMGRITNRENVNGSKRNVFNPKIEAPRILMPLRLETAIPSPVNTRPSAETDWLVGNMTPGLEEDYKDWKDQFQGNFDPTTRSQYEGMLRATDKKALENSNPINEGTRNNLLWDPNWVISVNKTYNTQTNALTGNELKLNGNLTMSQILAHNIFGLDPYTAMPMNVQQNVSWSLRNVPLIGGFLSSLTFGIPIGWQDTSIKVRMTGGVLLAIPASTKDYANVLVEQGDGVKIGLETFTDESAKNDAIEFSGIKATGSIWKAQLTHRSSKTINGNEYKFDNIYFGQTHPDKDDDGKDIDFGNEPKPEKLLWDETCKPTDRGDVSGYVIDTITSKFLGKMDYRLTLFSNNTQIWAGTYQTTSKFTGSIRDWTNAIKFSNWKVHNDVTISFPESIDSPNPPGVTNPKKELIKSETLGFITLKDDKTDPKTIFTFDTTPLGGINAIKNNYDILEIDVSIFLQRLSRNGNKRGQQKLKYNVDIDNLITSAKTEIPVIENKEYSLVYSDIPIGGDYTADKEYKADVTTDIEITVNGNVLEFILKQQKANYEDIGKVDPRSRPILDEVIFNEITNAILIPKTI